MLNHFSSLLNVRTGFFSPSGKEICAGLSRPVCEYCLQRRTDPAFNEKCRRLDAKMILQAQQKNRPLSYRCHGNLTEAVVPVSLHGRCAGLIMIGQFRTPECSPPEKLKPLHAKTPLFSEQQVADMLHILQLMADQISIHSLVHLRDFDLIQPLIDRIEKNPEQTISVKKAAAQTGRSPSGFAHLFKKLTGVSFRQYQINRRLQEASRLLRTFPHMPVKQIAEQTGFNDPLYFSRLYRKNFGHAPTHKKFIPPSAG